MTFAEWVLLPDVHKVFLLKSAQDVKLKRGHGRQLVEVHIGTTLLMEKLFL